MCQILVPDARVTELNLSSKRKKHHFKMVPRWGILMISLCFRASSVLCLVTFARAAQKQIYTQWCEALSSISGGQGASYCHFPGF